MARSESQTVRTLKRENRKLRRDISRLERELKRYQNLDVEDDEEVTEKAPDPRRRVGCPQCGGERVRAQMQLPNSNKMIRVCSGCGERYQVEEK
jgi:hypothetical protein